MRKKLTNIPIFILLVTIAIFSLALWPKDVTIDSWNDTLTVISTSRDSSACHVTHKNMTVSIFPGYTTSTPDSFNTANGDSTGVDVFVRFYADKQREHMVGRVQLFNPFQMVIAPTTTNFDSASVAVSLFNPTATAITAGAGDWDSTMVYLNDIVDYQKAKAYAKYYDILLDDATDETCPYTGSRYKVITTYSDF